LIQLPIILTQGNGQIFQIFFKIQA
jgi:hypothetical protein